MDKSALGSDTRLGPLNPMPPSEISPLPAHWAIPLCSKLISLLVYQHKTTQGVWVTLQIKIPAVPWQPTALYFLTSNHSRPPWQYAAYSFPVPRKCWWSSPQAKGWLEQAKTGNFWQLYWAMALFSIDLSKSQFSVLSGPKFSFWRVTEFPLLQESLLLGSLNLPGKVKHHCLNLSRSFIQTLHSSWINKVQNNFSH